MKPYERIELLQPAEVIEKAAKIIHGGVNPVELFPVLLNYDVYKRYKLERWELFTYSVNNAEMRFCCISAKGDVYLIFITGVVLP